MGWQEKEVEAAEENGGERWSEGFREDVKYGVTITAVGGRLDSIVGRNSRGNNLRVMCEVTITSIVVTFRTGVANSALFKINPLTARERGAEGSE